MIIRTVLATSALAVLGACATMTPEAELVDISPIERVSKPLSPETADMLLARGYFEQAAIAYGSALVSNPEDPAARYGLAESQRLAGRLDDARREFESLITVPEWRVRGLENLARIALAAGDRAGAMEKFSAVVAEDPTAWHSWLGVAQLHDVAREWTKADEAYALALAASKEPAVVYNNQGISMIARGNPDAAVGLFRNAVAADPKLVRAATNLDLAEAAAGERASLDAGDSDARERARKLNNYGYVAMLQDRTEDARRYFEAAIKEHPSFYALAFNNLKSLETSGPKPQQ
jgi:Flp pilus assembly protein TadD